MQPSKFKLQVVNFIYDSQLPHYPKVSNHTWHTLYAKFWTEIPNFTVILSMIAMHKRSKMGGEQF